ncbi:MAG: membrane protein insertase YidC [Steroidobacteraceae bacterium]|nr:membrane protein insertase YidC [Steroidobacteraceae bacterium]MBP7013836.1 membrane protein insertase YidC [Steroidobacteraceae bacterium]
MDNPRLFLWIGLALLAWMNIIQWDRDYGVQSAATTATSASSATSPVVAPAAPGAASSSLPELPSATVPAAAAPAAATPAPVSSAATAPSVRVVTDVLDMDISLQGGDLLRADLLQYPQDKQPGSPAVRLLSTDDTRFSVVRSGLRAADGRAEPTHLAHYTAPASEFRLAPGAQELRVPLTWTDGQGVTVMKTYVFKPGQYAIDVQYEVKNASGVDWQAASYVQFARHVYSQKRSMFDVESYAFRGPAVYDGKKYQKLSVDDEDDAAFRQAAAGGWMAEMQHHFVSAAVPPKAETYDYSLQREGDHSVVSYRGPLKSVPAGASAAFSEKLFIGPKLQDQLKLTGPKLELTVDYGKLTILANPLFHLLQWVHKYVQNWGVTIIIVTILLKLLFYKLTEKSGRSMAKMRAIAPRIKAIQERYKDDREQLAKQTMELYKREKINPVAGCLPILIQIPVFLAFYWALLESVEMRQAPFFGWIQDLSSKDPYFILPILMGFGMFAQFKLNPAPPDPMQAKMFAFMPVIMTVMMAWFPAGLVLYWLTNTLLSIAQQWQINRVVLAEAKKSGSTA